MAEPQTLPFQPGDLVRERRSGRPAIVRAVLLPPARQLVLELDDGACVLGDYSRWEQRPDPLVVETVPLAGILETFVADWRRKRPMRGSGFRKPSPSDVEPVNPHAWLAEETGLTREQLRKLMKPDEHPHTELRVADALVAAIGEPGMFHDGTLTVVENPRA